MKIKISATLFLFWITCIPIFAQNDSVYVTTTVDIAISATNFASSKAALLEYIQTNEIKVLNQNESRSSIDINFPISEKQYYAIDGLFQKLGYTSSKKINTLNNQSKVKEIQHELTYLKNKKASYAELIGKMDEKSDNYYSFWKDLKNIEETLYQKEKELLAYSNKTNGYMVSLNMEEENTTPDETRVSFVNMPGVEYSYLKIESPLQGVSSNAYQGYFVKYMFTRGKSYVTTGAYKAQKLSAKDTLAYSEMFVLAFGQDFYTRHLGRGTRRYLNLYSGYTVGGIMATSSSRKKNILYIAPSVGVELFKNKYVLFDTRVSYFIPFADNRNLRGLSYTTSFNFVF